MEEVAMNAHSLLRLIISMEDELEKLNSSIYSTLGVMRICRRNWRSVVPTDKIHNHGRIMMLFDELEAVSKRYGKEVEKNTFYPWKTMNVDDVTFNDLINDITLHKVYFAPFPAIEKVATEWAEIKTSQSLIHDLELFHEHLVPPQLSNPDEYDSDEEFELDTFHPGTEIMELNSLFIKLLTTGSTPQLEADLKGKRESHFCGPRAVGEIETNTRILHIMHKAFVALDIIKENLDVFRPKWVQMIKGPYRDLEVVDYCLVNDVIEMRCLADSIGEGRLKDYGVVIRRRNPAGSEEVEELEVQARVHFHFNNIILI